MATLNGTIREVFGFTTPLGPYKSGAATPQAVFGCYVTVDFTAGDVYAQADDATIAAVATAIQNARRNGKTVTLLGAAVAAPGLEGTSAFGLGLPTSLATGGIVAPVTGTDLATERSNGAMGAANRPVCIFVCFEEV